MTVNTKSYRANRFLDRNQDTISLNDKMYVEDSVIGPGTIVLATGFISSYGTCYPGSCFKPVTLYPGPVTTNTSVCICALCVSAAGTSLKGCWTPLSNMPCSTSIGLVMRVK